MTPKIVEIEKATALPMLQRIDRGEWFIGDVSQYAEHIKIACALVDLQLCDCMATELTDAGQKLLALWGKP